MSISTHILDTSRGRPAAGVPVSLDFQTGTNEWQTLGTGVTDADGRNRTLLPEGHVMEAGRYRMTFNTEAYFQSQKQHGFYPYVQIVFELREPELHYHIPLLLSPFGYSTYRGS